MSFRDRIVENWRDVLKHWSTWAQAAGVFAMTGAEAIREGWAYVPPDLRATLPYAPTIGLILFGAGLAAKFIKQKPHG